MVTRVSLVVCALFGMLVVAGSARAEGEVAAKLVGTWQGDAEKTTELLKEAGVGEDEIEEILSEIGSVTLSIAKDNKFTVKIPDAPEDLSGTWKIKEEDADEKKVVLEMILKFGDLEQPMDFTFTIMSAEYVKVQPDEEQPAVFKKKDD